ncbi:hypothetical protein BV20DRAFT_937980, partial [Pilatotrama ljubarskyi]
LVAEISTLRRHLQATHLNAYYTWATSNNFDSMLPKDTRARREERRKNEQSTLDFHVKPKAPRPPVVKYSDELFRQAAIEWLIATDQPVQALEHPKFQEMIDIAARATEGVKLPNRKQTRSAIIKMFKDNLTKLRERLNVSRCPL